MGTADGVSPAESGTDDCDLAEQLVGDTDAIRAYIAERDGEVRDLRRQLVNLEQFRGLAVDMADSLAAAGRRARQSLD